MNAEVYGGWAEQFASEPKGMRAGWLAVLGKPTFPRDIVLPIAGAKRYQKQVRNPREFYAVVEDHAPRGDLWASWSTTQEYDLPGMDRIFGDVDSIDLEDALVRARRFEDWCIRHFDVQPPAIFTAGKGFHLHFTMDYVEGLGSAFSDAFGHIVQGSGATLDPQPLKHRKTYPRLPYCMNLKATGRNRQPMFTVPVDLAWDLKEILRASAEIRVTPFKVPHSPNLAELLQPIVDRNLEQQARRRKASTEQEADMQEALVQAALAFSEDVGWRLVDSRGHPDGRRRLLNCLYIPALLWRCKGDEEQVTAAVEAWVDMSGGQWRNYKGFTKDAIKHCARRDGTLRLPMSLRRFWQEANNLRVR